MNEGEVAKGKKWNTKEITNNNKPIGSFQAVCKEGVGEGESGD